MFLPSVVFHAVLKVVFVGSSPHWFAAYWSVVGAPPIGRTTVSDWTATRSLPAAALVPRARASELELTSWLTIFGPVGAFSTVTIGAVCPSIRVASWYAAAAWVAALAGGRGVVDVDADSLSGAVVAADAMAGAVAVRSVSVAPITASTLAPDTLSTDPRPPSVAPG